MTPQEWDREGIASCAWCGATLLAAERRGDVCNDCLSGRTICDACGHPLRDHDDGECPPMCDDAPSVSARKETTMTTTATTITVDQELPVWCESCLVAGEHVPATGHSANPDWSGYDLCDACRAEYDSRPPVDDRHIKETTMRKVTAVTRITYEPGTDLIEIRGKRQVGSLPAHIMRDGYTIASDQVMGWGDHNAVIFVDSYHLDPTYGYWLATLDDA